MNSRLVKLIKLGQMRYDPCLKLQNHLSETLKTTAINECGYLIIVEHEPVYTIGIRQRDYDILLENNLVKLGAEFKRTNRGGLITFHGPGQLIAYPILNLKYFQPSVRWYVTNLETTIVNLCNKTYGLNANTTPDTGVWIGNNKICAVGIRCSRYVTTHGIALNCNTDLSWFKHIIPCGLHNKGVTSLSSILKKDISINDVLPNFLIHFSKSFSCEIVNSELDEIK
ncbi:Biotinyl protein ligase (BPL) and lipoyl protein ligase (LPL), catalytic [Cinara cedri]|uniref:Octanoyl-[acyl-carrier-protein]:protein N-octanoyltransferase LIPT2, mitochondrial n=1 Tax=Cinara cedri TaxID=506608 RepID=A0A5E4MH15_9HEMI|nr:Biotinyl protein ligase (BPL) and lipoyl protein ligase (LPL), catalytic [Cinara cedri]